LIVSLFYYTFSKVTILVLFWNARMTLALDPINQNFVGELTKGQPLYEKTPSDARQALETLQKYVPAPDIAQDYIDVPLGSGSVKTVIFRPENANRDIPSIFYTHGGGWIMGRCVLLLTRQD
jgi:acetyl esterase/lipase